MRTKYRCTFFVGISLFLLVSACGQKQNPVPSVTPSVTTEPTVQIWTPAPTATPEPVITEEPVITPTPLPTAAAETTETPAATNSPTLTATSTPTPEPTATPSPTPAVTVEDFDAAAFFEDALFSGDSVMSHFYWRVPYYDKETFGGSTFIAAPSYCLREALKVDSELHPMYRGESKPLWENMKIVEPSRVFLFFGLNDIGISGVDKFVENYGLMLQKIREVNPKVKVYIISITPMRADSEKKVLNNANIIKANEKLQEFCRKNDVGYIDVATMLQDENGALNLEYSDGTNVHLTKEAYILWKEVLVQYAKEQLLAEYYDSLN